MYAIKPFKICAEYRDMLPRPRLDLSGTPGLRPIGLSPGSWQTSLGLGSMSRYSAQILICIIYIYICIYLLCVFVVCVCIFMHLISVYYKGHINNWANGNNDPPLPIVLHSSQTRFLQILFSIMIFKIMILKYLPYFTLANELIKTWLAQQYKFIRLCTQLRYGSVRKELWPYIMYA